jgi:hypothetical protein
LSDVISSIIKSRTRAKYSQAMRKTVGDSEAMHFMQIARGISSEEALQQTLLSRLVLVFGFFPGLKINHIDSSLRAHHTTLSVLMDPSTA